MKITEARLKQIIAEEKAVVLSEGNKVRGAQSALQEIAMQSALLHDSDKLSTISEQDLKKIKVIAEYLDSIFYRTTNS
jgi:hypothetical protein